MHAVDITFILCLLLALAYLIILPSVDREVKIVRNVLVYIATFLLARYLIWRVFSVADSHELSIAYSMAVLVLAIEVLHGWLSMRSMPGNRFRSNRSEQANCNHDWWKDSPPRVEILIPTYNESYSILERTLVGVKNLDYPNFYANVLDDGRREWVRDLATEFGMNYITRPSNEGYKAGNLNNALRALCKQGIDLQFIAVFDADFISRPNFLIRTLALFGPGGERTALVQTPQYFFNPDPFQYAFNAHQQLPDEQRAWFDYRIPVIDAGGNAFCCGTSFVARYSPLNQIGLFPTETICEDSHASIKLKELEWETVYLNEVLSVGLAPEGVNEYLTQRYRWCLGWMQIAKLKWLSGKDKISLKDMWKFFVVTSKWPLPCLVRVVWTCMPLLLVLFDSTVYQMTTDQFLEIRLPLFVAMYGLLWLSGFSIVPFFSDGLVIFVAPTLFKACYNFALRRDGERFVVTDKGINRNSWSFHWKVARFPLALFLLIFGAFVWEVTLSNRIDTDFGRVGIFLWAVFNCVILYVAIVPCFEPPQTRDAVRFRCDFPVDIFRAGQIYCARVVDLSERGVRLSGVVNPGIEEELLVNFEKYQIKVAAQVRHIYADGTAGLEFICDATQRRELIRIVLASDGFVPILREWRSFDGLKSILRHMLSSSGMRSDRGANTVRKSMFPNNAI